MTALGATMVNLPCPKCHQIMSVDRGNVFQCPNASCSALLLRLDMELMPVEGDASRTPLQCPKCSHLNIVGTASPKARQRAYPCGKCATLFRLPSDKSHVDEFDASTSGWEDDTEAENLAWTVLDDISPPHTISTSSLPDNLPLKDDDDDDASFKWSRFLLDLPSATTDDTI